MVKKQPLISVIIPTRNRYDYIRLMLEDLKNQDVSNFEVIVVDQSDIPENIDGCAHFISKTLGPCVSRNIGAKEAKGEVLVFLDDDARIYPDFIREITNPIIHDRFDGVAGAVCDQEGNFKRKDSDMLKAYGINFIKVLTRNPDSPSSRITLSFPAGCSAIKKVVFENVNGFDESFDPTGAGEDRDMALKLYIQGYAIWYNSSAKLLHAEVPYGGAREIGERSMMLDAHTYRMCKKYFSTELAKSLRKNILKRYKDNLKNALLNFNKVRTKCSSYLRMIRLLK
ncbi:glycosyltransferase family 2 protein [Urechidicola vernalis]|uniref:Glycosyltransferase family 2 protein n=1 Tax=Urechidicola vernalis TaxID=3075600 RepID=A0ABU2Y2K6_9FLAO|nr:glycosyltransferase family 2 protein [Urechidicola sp. P050]MDT0552267.1 glycosyltransferase family 2 protein [Urechidicola sp. P050]